MGITKWWKSLTGSVSRRGVSTPAMPPSDLGGDTGWENEAIRLYDLVPELRYGISWIASSASRSSLVVARVPDHPAASPIPVDEDAVESSPLYDLAPTAPDQAVLIEHMATLLKLTGRWNLIGFDDSGRRRWVVVSSKDYQYIGANVRFRHPDTAEHVTLPRVGTPESQGSESAWLIPMWRPHPVHSWLPDSPVRALIDTLHELVDLSGHVQTAARSRLAGKGILLMPSSLTPIAPGQPTGVNPPKGSPAMRALTRTAQAAFQNPHDISRHLPVIFEGRQESLNAVRHVTLDTPFDERVDELRTSAIRRVAIGLDIPPEVLSGMGDLNHWTAWQVDSAGQKINVAPTLAFLCRELTGKYLQPALRALGVSNPQDFMIWYDDTALTNTPNKDEVALTAYELGLISGDAARTTIGYGPADAPEDGELPAVTRARLSTGVGNGGIGPASTEETQVRFPTASVGARDGWVACADVSARRALGRAGQYLLGSGGRALRGKYRDVPIHNVHTKVAPGNDDVIALALRGAFTELSDVEPDLVGPVSAYAKDRLANRAPHDVSVLAKYLIKKEA